jgi:hypothetical protein
MSIQNLKRVVMLGILGAILVGAPVDASYGAVEPVAECLAGEECFQGECSSSTQCEGNEYCCDSASPNSVCCLNGLEYCVDGECIPWP